MISPITLQSDDPRSQDVVAELNKIIGEVNSSGDAPVQVLRNVFCEIIRQKLAQIKEPHSTICSVEDCHTYSCDRGSIFWETGAMSQLLEERGVEIKAAMLIFNGLLGCVNDHIRLSLPTPLSAHIDFEEDEEGGVPLPEHLENARERILDFAYKWYRRKTGAEIDGLTLQDKIAEVQRRLVKEEVSISPTAPQYVQALDAIEDELLAMYEIEQSWSGETDASSSDEYDPAKRGLTRQLAMLLLDELFPNLKGASKRAKAEFLGFLTGWDSEALRQKWTDYQRGNPTALEKDRAEVQKWKLKLKIPN